MASILFDDITFPRELYDPDTFEFVPPVSTLLAFTPHILSQLAKTEQEQEPMPIPNPNTQQTMDANSDSKNNNIKDETQQAENASTSASSSSSSSSKGFFSKLQNLAPAIESQKILENGLYLAGRYMDGAASAASSSSRRYHNEDAWERSSASSTSSSWFGSKHRNWDQERERERLREMEQRLQQMERDMRHHSATARSEIDAQRRERHKLEQELELQKTKVKKLEAEMEQQQKKKKEEEKEKEKEREKKRKEQEDELKRAEKERKSKDEKDKEKEETSQEMLKKNGQQDPASLALMATVGVASLVATMYSAHKASSTYSVIGFHNQLEELLKQCEDVVQSTEAWISEQFLEVPEQVQEDLRLIKELIDIIHRLDPRTEKKAETVAWSMSAVGSLGAMGGVVMGSMTAMASGGTLVIGCALYGIIARARYNGPEYKGARTTMELKAAQILRSLGVNPASPHTITSGQRTAAATRTTLIHDNRIDRLRLEFEKRDGHDLVDADEIDGMAVEDALRDSAFSLPFVSQRTKQQQQQQQQQQQSSRERIESRQDRGSMRVKRESMMAFA
ncbi:hypothetical protein BX616_009272 [Lobosporangium transversale]|uniref:Uncharacterized protein n=1 Tax=Lobosporangium transversale TaxID=64571 RepID=A0A1Y2GIA0_9FUNG|nr:hypothetical protein BCR41DRAFT_388113 [Lobosporangium transversale]KAF9913943.1 hypothetical protein BX616_009272 [Lobosporangium transversale]ORZ09973.1 hypothetical protein BCR41DRAFT_388113 [Lobosporangium transversale]|eukprot:XP_021879063.1 hypothetical protein BCR41DRAFT_388113 [Lobosporangium transversale]